MQDAMAIIKRGLGVATPATQSLGLSGLGTVTSQTMNTQVQERKKGILPDAASVRDLFGG